MQVSLRCQAVKDFLPHAHPEAGAPGSVRSDIFRVLRKK